MKIAPIVSLLLLLSGDGSFVSQNKDANASDYYGTLTNNSKNMLGKRDCFTIGAYAKKEACIALSEDLKDCSDSDLRCAPYKKMYFEEQTLENINTDLIVTASELYAEYATDDTAYLDDLTIYFNESDRVWRTYRDAQCELEPFIQGVSRRESYDMTEVCRLDETRKRISMLREVRFSLKDDGETP